MPKPRKEITSETLEKLISSGQKKFVRYDEGAVLYSVGLHTFQQIAKDAGAVYRVKRVVLSIRKRSTGIWRISAMRCKTVAIWTKTDRDGQNTDKYREKSARNSQETLERWNPFIYNMDKDVMRGAQCREEKEPEGRNWMIQKQIKSA